MWQFMLSRPIVAAPLTGVLLGDAGAGLLVGVLVELLWLGRLPVGAAIPPDDTQVAVAATALTAILGPLQGYEGPAFAVLATIVTLPLGKVGQLFDRAARYGNGRLLTRAEEAVAEGRVDQIERLHLCGLGNFALAALATFVVLFISGSFLVTWGGPSVFPLIDKSIAWWIVAFPCIGAGAIMGTINVTRRATLFTASFATVFLTLWLL
ncbi:hypothetical protein AOP6_1343 [Desulfuromonas sp. AOP6]|nr:hypothetical protein AOP6_1343 [Desulfuromonas sp. AOP6]